MTTSHRDVADDGAGAEALADEATDTSTEEVIARLERRHLMEVRAIEERHRAMIDHIRNSPTFKVGELIVGLRRAPGWRALPGRLRDVGRSVRSRRPAATLPTTGFPSVDGRDSRRAVSILDEFSEACLGPELTLVPAKRDGWPDQLDDAAVVVAETAWRGNRGDWSYTMTKFAPDGDLASLLDEARRRGVPSVLWNKEDPVSYETFLPVAKRFDVVVTTDADMVPRYREDLGHERVGTCMFAAQPAIHNPIGRPSGPLSSIAFAGAWRGHKYPERARQFAGLLEAAQRAGDLRIFDREPNHSVPGEGFPAEFHDNIVGTLPYVRMVDEYRRHACFLNVNTVTTSPTMMSRRVFELLACRTPVVSSPSEAIERHLGHVVPTPSDPSAAHEVLARLVTDPDHRDRLGQRGYRAVMSEHTYQHRVGEVLSTAGLGGFPSPSQPTIDVICVTNRPEYIDRVVDNVSRQVYPALRLILVTNSDAFERDEVERAVASFDDAIVLHLPEHMTLGECLNVARDHGRSEFFAKIDDDDHYGAHYFSDMVLATRYADAAVYGKRAFHAYVESSDVTVVRHERHEFEYTTFVMGGTLLARRSAVAGIPFASLPSGSDSHFLSACRDSGLKVFSTDRFNYLMVRRADTSAHTWKIDDDEFLATSRRLGRGLRTDDVLI